MLRKGLIALATAVTVAAGTVAAPRPAAAVAEWVVPVIIVAGVGGLILGAAAANANPYAWGPRGDIYVNPTNCYYARERVRGGWRRVQVCR